MSREPSRCSSGAEEMAEWLRPRSTSVGEASTSVDSSPSLTPSRKGVRVHPQKIARVTGVLFLITFITSIPLSFCSVRVSEELAGWCL